MSTLDAITKENQRVSEALARIDAQRERQVSKLRELESTERVLTRYIKCPQGRKTSSVKNANQGNDRARSSAATRAPAHHDRNTGWRQARLVKSERSGSSSGNRQDQREIIAACKGARPNHVGAAIARHKWAGRIEERDERLYAIRAMGTEQPTVV